MNLRRVPRRVRCGARFRWCWPALSWGTWVVTPLLAVTCAAGGPPPPAMSTPPRPPAAGAARHDPLLATAARERAAALRAAGRADAADLLEAALAARLRGQRSYAEQLFSATERLTESGDSAGDLLAVAPLFREGGP